MKLDSAILDQYIYGFYGYGNYQANYWFMGMEHGGGRTYEEISLRISAWDERGQCELEDIKEYHEAINITWWFQGPMKVQRTWGQLIRFYLAAEGLEDDLNVIQAYQVNKLGRLDGDTCLLEILPLPSPNIGDWFYSNCSNLDYLTSREDYIKTCIPLRIEHLQKRIKQYKPHVVVFYGFGYFPHWEKIAGSPFPQNHGDEFLYQKKGDTIFVVLKHPATWGITKDYFIHSGNSIRLVG